MACKGTRAALWLRPPPAAAARVMKKNFQKFAQRIIPSASCKLYVKILNRTAVEYREVWLIRLLPVLFYWLVYIFYLSSFQRAANVSHF